MNNLIMYNRGGSGSLWPQMLGRAKCGAETGQPLARVPVFEMLWRGWKDLYPETQVVSSESNISRNYAVNPYGDYDSLDNERFLYPNMPDVDRRRPVKERVLGLPATADGREPGIAFPLLGLDGRARELDFFAGPVERTGRCGFLGGPARGRRCFWTVAPANRREAFIRSQPRSGDHGHRYRDRLEHHRSGARRAAGRTPTDAGRRGLHRFLGRVGCFPPSNPVMGGRLTYPGYWRGRYFALGPRLGNCRASGWTSLPSESITRIGPLRASSAKSNLKLFSPIVLRVSGPGSV